MEASNHHHHHLHHHLHKSIATMSTHRVTIFFMAFTSLWSVVHLDSSSTTERTDVYCHKTYFIQDFNVYGSPKSDPEVPPPGTEPVKWVSGGDNATRAASRLSAEQLMAEVNFLHNDLRRERSRRKSLVDFVDNLIRRYSNNTQVEQTWQRYHHKYSTGLDVRPVHDVGDDTEEDAEQRHHAERKGRRGGRKRGCPGDAASTTTSKANAKKITSIKQDIASLKNSYGAIYQAYTTLATSHRHLQRETRRYVLQGERQRMYHAAEVQRLGWALANETDLWHAGVRYLMGKMACLQDDNKHSDACLHLDPSPKPHVLNRNPKVNLNGDLSASGHGNAKSSHGNAGSSHGNSGNGHGTTGNSHSTTGNGPGTTGNGPSSTGGSRQNATGSEEKLQSPYEEFTVNTESSTKSELQQTLRQLQQQQQQQRGEGTVPTRAAQQPEPNTLLAKPKHVKHAHGLKASLVTATNDVTGTKHAERGEEEEMDEEDTAGEDEAGEDREVEDGEGEGGEEGGVKEPVPPLGGGVELVRRTVGAAGVEGAAGAAGVNYEQLRETFTAAGLEVFKTVMEQLRENRPKDCSEIDLWTQRHAPHQTIYLKHRQVAARVYCDDGWTVIQHNRKSSRPSSPSSWRDFRDGLGTPAVGQEGPEGLFWIGNEYIHRLTSQGDYRLKIELGSRGWASYYKHSEYSSFKVKPEGESYTLEVLSGTGTAGDVIGSFSSMSLSGAPFATRDRSNSSILSRLAAAHGVGWWYPTVGGVGSGGGGWGGVTKRCFTNLNAYKPWFCDQEGNLNYVDIVVMKIKPNTK